MKCSNFPPAAGFASNRAKIQFLKCQNLLVSRGASIRLGPVAFISNNNDFQTFQTFILLCTKKLTKKFWSRFF